MAGGATGNPHEAERLILSMTATPAGQPISGSKVATVHCSEAGQSVLERVASFFSGGSASEQQRSAPATTYSCSGAAVDGTPLYWCVAFPPRGNPYHQSPSVTIRQPDEACP